MTVIREPLPVDSEDPLSALYMDGWLKDLYLTCQNLSLTQREGTIQNYDKAGNLAAQYVVYTSNAVADTEDTIPHTLGHVPTGYIVVKQDKAGIPYDGSTAATTTNLYLKCNVASVAFTLLIY